MLQRLNLPADLDGSLWKYAHTADANRRHHHVELELNLVTAGRGSYLIGNRRYEIRRGDLLWLFPAQEHVLFEQTPDFEMWIAVFRRRAVKRCAIDASSKPLLQRSSNGESCRRLNSSSLTRLETFFSDLAESPDPGLLNNGLGYILLRAWKDFLHAAEVPVRELHPAVERAAALMRHEGADYGLEELAHRSGLSASRLSRLFKEQTGSSLVDFRNRQRIERFQQIYDSGNGRTLLEAALEAGFGSYPQFHRVFHQVIGCSPAQYARRTLR